MRLVTHAGRRRAGPRPARPELALFRNSRMARVGQVLDPLRLKLALFRNSRT